MDYTADRVVDEIKDVFDFKIKEENIAKSFVFVNDKHYNKNLSTSDRQSLQKGFIQKNLGIS